MANNFVAVSMVMQEQPTYISLGTNLSHPDIYNGGNLKLE